MTTTKQVGCCANDMNKVNIRVEVALNTMICSWDILLILLARLTLRKKEGNPKKLQMGGIKPADVNKEKWKIICGRTFP